MREEVGQGAVTDITLIAVSKTVDADSVMQAARAGIRDFGENRVQEFLKKREAIGDAVSWHIIGPLQRNKVRFILDGVTLLHSLDRFSLAQEIETQCDKKGTAVFRAGPGQYCQRADKIRRV